MVLALCKNTFQKFFTVNERLQQSEVDKPMTYLPKLVFLRDMEEVLRSKSSNTSVVILVAPNILIVPEVIVLIM